jgi:hypothetical protein
MGCGQDQLPLRSRIEAVSDGVELDDVYATERQLFMWRLRALAIICSLVASVPVQSSSAI